MDAQDIGGFDGNESQQGQGLAYVLPQSRTVGYFMQLANEQAQQRRDDAAAIQQAQQKANAQYAQHLYEQKTPKIANEYTNWLQPKFDQVLNDAADYHTKTGQDPFTQPQFVQRINDLNTVANSTHEANLRHTAYATQIADKSKNYTPESKQAGIDWLTQYQKDPVGNLYAPPPDLIERNLDMNDAIKLGHAVAKKETVNGYNITAPDRGAHIAQARTVLSQPEFAPMLQQNGIDPHVGDIGGQPNGHGGVIYPTDAPTVNAIADHIIQNANQPHYAATLQAAGIDPLDPHAKDKLTELVQRQNAGYGKVYTDFANRLDANIGQEKLRNTSDERLALSEANLSLAEQRLAMQKDKQEKNTQPIYRQKLITDMLTGVPNSGEELKAKIAADPTYDGPLLINKGKGNLAGQIGFGVPAKQKWDASTNSWTEVSPAHTVWINPKDPNANIKLNELTNQLTGEKVDISSLQTLGGKKHLPVVNGQQAQPKHKDPLGIFN